MSKPTNMFVLRSLILIAFFQALYLVALISARPNIRIQVNNENTKTAPYLLEAIKHADSLTNERTVTSGETIAPSNLSEKEEENEDAEPHKFSLVKEETVEEILDLDPESLVRIPDEVFAESSETGPISETNKPTSELLVQNRKSQLPVTSSHLKRPIVGSLEDELGQKSLHLDAKEGGGAKSLVSPTVNADESVLKANPAVKRVVGNPPDTWEPSQIMNGVTNISAIPATVNKEYGHQTRTRVTLGGGYVRHKQPSSDRSDGDSLEKPNVLPEKSPSQKTEPIDVTRVLHAPERLILSESAIRLVVNQESAARNQTFKGKQDSRCPKKGVTTFEHSTACDKYFYCEDGLIQEQICPNGLMYGVRDTVIDFCVHRWKVSCEDKSVPNPISSPGCRWQYGIFNVQGSPKCTPDYYECTEGKFEVKKCSIDGQVYDDGTKTCKFAETVGCTKELLADFQCPPDDQGNTYWPFPRYFLNERALIHCINDKPEIVRCTGEDRVDPEHLHCVPVNKDGSLTDRKAREKNKKSSD